MERAEAHVLLDKIYNGGDAGHIRAIVSTLRVYASSVDEREEIQEMRMEVAKLRRSIERMEVEAMTLGFAFHVQGRG